MKSCKVSYYPSRSYMSDAAVFSMRLLLAKKAENLLAKSKNEAMKLGSKAENQYLVTLVNVYGKALHLT